MTGKITIKTPYSGWAYTLANNSAAVPGTPYQYTKSSNIALNRPGYEGLISPGYVFDTMSDAGAGGSAYVNELPLNVVTNSGGTAFVVMRNARVAHFVVTTDVINGCYPMGTATVHSGHTVATSTNADILILKDKASTPRERVLVSYEDGTDADIALINTDGTGQNTSWFSTRSGGAVLKKGVPLKMFTGPDGLHYCTNGQYLASMDVLGDATGATAADCVVNAQALDIEPGWVISAGCAWDNYIAFVAYKDNFNATNGAKGASRLFLWNGRDPSYQFVYDLDDYYVSAIYNKDGVLHIWTSGRNNTTKLRLFNGALDPKPSFESSLIGPVPYHGAVDNWLGQMTWGNTAGSVYSWGSNDPEIPPGFHNPAGVGDQIGMIKNLTSNVLYAGVKSGSDYSMRKVNFDKYALSTTFRTCLNELPPRSTITMIRERFAQQGAGASHIVSLFSDYTAASVGGATDLLNETVTPNTSVDTYYNYIARTIPNINQFYMIISFNHPAETNTATIISEIEVEYEYEPLNA